MLFTLVLNEFMKKTKKKRSLTLILRNYFITGVVVLIPIGFTLYLSKVLISISSNIIPENIIELSRVVCNLLPLSDTTNLTYIVKRK